MDGLLEATGVVNAATLPEVMVEGASCLLNFDLKDCPEVDASEEVLPITSKRIRNQPRCCNTHTIAAPVR